ncbi:hypothetical protein BDV96DRAFT_654514 [Lophiotrema nucula]|uniref:Uncharacterized protein n=1 Tax=Lophiotrema nucula TaxID=690887 RepID=A0A6A5YJ22_9PLEO|nr:hypothetical protein BDV96DRAFT_654514 [Lophiotrema nucula]
MEPQDLLWPQKERTAFVFLLRPPAFRPLPSYGTYHHGFDNCMLSPTPSKQAFLDQAPNARIFHLVPTEPTNEHEIYQNWTRTAKIASVSRSSRHRDHMQEPYILLKAYEYGLQLGSDGSAFRDALVDAVAEWLDMYGRKFFPYIHLVEAVSSAERYTLPERLLAYCFAISTESLDYKMRLPDREETQRFVDCFGRS